ncbi:olfactory receptor 14J1-like [Opisthocomus hoazin]|uniref:olfactory receptor 14J1-like n=1 Tax=Opisthocomus hoazin TaxID=30419 RepID=UPI003F529B02
MNDSVIFTSTEDIIKSPIHDCTIEGMVKQWHIQQAPIKASVTEMKKNLTEREKKGCVAGEGSKRRGSENNLLNCHCLFLFGLSFYCQRDQMSNGSSVTDFTLLAFADTRELQLLHFWLFLAIYLAALLSNGLIITAIACDHRLHTPMYFFLLNLSLIDLGSISTTVPKSMANSLWDTRTISYAGCAAQIFQFIFLVGAEYCLLTIMAYDHYIVICKPLHYGTLLGSRTCVHMRAAAWGSAFINALLHTVNTFTIPLCQGNAVEQFFCEIPQILKLSCSHSYLREAGLLGVSVSLVFGCFVFIVLSYVQIFRAVLMIPSEQGQHKAFSTCLPHLAVVSPFISTVVPPAVNPLFYSMRNQELNGALKNLILNVCIHSTAAET